MNKKPVKFLVIYVLSLLLLCACFYFMLMPKEVKLGFTPPVQTHIDFLAEYDWQINKTTNKNSYELYSSPWVEQYKNMGLDLTPYINLQLDSTTYLLHEQEVNIEGEYGNIYMTIFEHNGMIIGAMGHLENWVPGYLPVTDKQRLIDENRLK